jgi:hypothetical protein
MIFSTTATADFREHCYSWFVESRDVGVVAYNKDAMAAASQRVKTTRTPVCAQAQGLTACFQTRAYAFL